MNKKITYFLIAAILLAFVGMYSYSLGLRKNIEPGTQAGDQLPPKELVNTNTANQEVNQPSQNSNIVIDNLKAGDEISSPLEITGKARTWYFEGSFPINILDEKRNVIALGIAQAQGDWMTSEFVPFKATITFAPQATQEGMAAATEKSGIVVLSKDNPSDLRKFDESVEIPVIFKPVEALTVKVYFHNTKLDPEVLDCSKVFAITRKITKTQTTARATLEELLKGPTVKEVSDGYITNINSGVKLNKVTIIDGIAKADFDKQLEFQVGGSCRVASISAQITETLKQFPSVQKVIISIDGRSEDILQP